MNLIVNADDFGLSKATNLGILEAFENGIVRSTTIIVNKKGFEHAVYLYKNNSILNIGVHLNLTSGEPLISNHKTIVSSNGDFLNQTDFYNSADQIDLNEVKKEFYAQIEKVKKSGIKITHLDSHHHVHMVSGVRKIVNELADEFDLFVRPLGENKVYNKNRNQINLNFSDKFYNEITEDSLIDIIKSYNGTDLEIMCHPAYVDRELMSQSSYNLKRVDELNVLCSKKIKDYIESNNINLIDYSCLYK